MESARFGLLLFSPDETDYVIVSGSASLPPNIKVVIGRQHAANIGLGTG